MEERLGAGSRSGEAPQKILDIFFPVCYILPVLFWERLCICTS